MNGAEGEAGRFVFAEGGYGTHEPRDSEGRCDDGLVGTACQLPGMAYWPKSTQQQESRVDSSQVQIGDTVDISDFVPVRLTNKLL